MTTDLMDNVQDVRLQVAGARFRINTLSTTKKLHTGWYGEKTVITWLSQKGLRCHRWVHVIRSVELKPFLRDGNQILFAPKAKLRGSMLWRSTTKPRYGHVQGETYIMLKTSDGKVLPHRKWVSISLSSSHRKWSSSNLSSLFLKKFSSPSFQNKLVKFYHTEIKVNNMKYCLKIFLKFELWI